MKPQVGLATLPYLLSIAFVRPVLAVDVPEIPEPLVFDLMRGLHAPAGEIEINTLMQLDRHGDLQWAPEIEYTIADGMGIEFEVPFENRERESWKFGFQFRLGYDAQNVHGVQLLAERFDANEDTAYNALYLLGHRFNERWSVLGMLGPQALRQRGGDWTWRGITNLALFHDHSNGLTSGVEVNWLQRSNWRREALTITPQMHWHLSANWNVQGGIGLTKPPQQSWEPVYTLRVIWER
jgi:hypothetical protein